MLDLALLRCVMESLGLGTFNIDTPLSLMSTTTIIILTIKMELKMKKAKAPLKQYLEVCFSNYRCSMRCFKFNYLIDTYSILFECIQMFVNRFAGFHSCTIGKGGYDLAHFLLTSTTREFRTQNLELVLKSYIAELDDVISSQGKFNFARM